MTFTNCSWWRLIVRGEDELFVGVYTDVVRSEDELFIGVEDELFVSVDADVVRGEDELFVGVVKYVTHLAIKVTRSI